MAKEFALSAIDARPEEHTSIWNFSSPHAREELVALSQALYHTKKPGNIRKSFIDISLPVPGEHPFMLTRFYNSFYEGTSGFGFGWRIAPYELELAEEKVEINSSCGVITTYPALLLRSPEGEEIYTLSALDGEGCPLFTNRARCMWIKETSQGTFVLKNQKMAVEFDAQGRITAIRDSQGFATVYSYENERLMQISYEHRETIFLDYEEDRIVRAKGPHGIEIEYHYDVEKQLSASISSGSRISYEYDTSRRLSHLYDAANNLIFQAVYDPYHRATYVSEAGVSYSVDFSLAQRTMRIMNATAQETLLHFDEENRLIFKQEPSGRTWEFVYEQSHLPQPTKMIENHAFVTEWRYDDASRPVYFKNPQGGIWRFFYDSAGNLFAESAPGGRSILHFYDSQNRRTQSFLKADLTFDKGDPISTLKGFKIEGGDTISYSYDPETGKLASATNTLGGITTFTYDKSGHLEEICTPKGQTLRTDWDLFGNPVATKACGIVKTSIAYTENNRPKTIQTPLGTTEFVYDHQGDLIEILEPSKVATNYRYDSHHNLIEVIDAEGGVTRFTYNPQNQITRLYLPNGSIKILEYDPLGRLYKQTWKEF